MAAENPSSSNNNNGKITLKMVNNLKPFENCPSPVVKMGGFKWHLEMHKKPNEQLLDAIIVCHLDEEEDDPIEKLWMCRAKVGLSVDEWHSAGFFHFFNGHTHQKWTNGVLPEMSVARDFLVEMRVSVKSQFLQPSLPNLDTDLKLQFNDKEECMAVNKFTLAGISTYFRNLFFGNWSERAGSDPKKEFTIKEDPDFDLPAFKLMLYSAMAMGCLVADGKFLQDEFVLPILKLSIKYDVPMLQDYCQKYLLDPKADCPKMEVLEMAEQLGLHQLKDHCLATITPLDMAKDFTHNTELCARLGKRTRQQLDTRMRECAKKMRLQPIPTASCLKSPNSGSRQTAHARMMERLRFEGEDARANRAGDDEQQPHQGNGNE